MLDTVPSTPDPAIATLLATLLRYLLTAASAAGIYHGAIGDSTLSIIAGALVGAGTAAWAIWERFRIAQHTHEVAKASAVAGIPVQPTAKT